MSKLTVSCVIPVYNSEKTLVKCVNSILNGNYKNVKIVLVDDGSSDGSWHLCSQLSEQNSNIISLKNDRNRGASYTRNKGLEVIDTDYVTFVDSDDYVSEEYIELLIKYASVNDGDLVICGYYVDYVERDFKENVIWDTAGVETTIISPKNYLRAYERVFLQSPCNKIFDVRKLKDSGVMFDEKMVIGEDLRFVIDYICKTNCKRILSINKPLYHYIRTSEPTLMDRSGHENIEEISRCLLDLLDVIGNTKRQREQVLSLINRHKENGIYRIVRNKSISKHEKLRLIENIMKDNKAKMYYRKYMIGYVKETIAVWLHTNKISIREKKHK